MRIDRTQTWSKTALLGSLGNFINEKLESDIEIEVGVLIDERDASLLFLLDPSLVACLDVRIVTSVNTIGHFDKQLSYVILHSGLFEGVEPSFFGHRNRLNLLARNLGNVPGDFRDRFRLGEQLDRGQVAFLACLAGRIVGGSEVFERGLRDASLISVREGLLKGDVHRWQDVRRVDSKWQDRLEVRKEGSGPQRIDLDSILEPCQETILLNVRGENGTCTACLLGTD